MLLAVVFATGCGADEVVAAWVEESDTRHSSLQIQHYEYNEDTSLKIQHIINYIISDKNNCPKEKLMCALPVFK